MSNQELNNPREYTMIDKTTIHIKLTADHIMTVRSRYNGVNGFVKSVFEKLYPDIDTKKKKWLKELIGRPIPETVFKDMVRYRNLHLDDVPYYNRLRNKVKTSNIQPPKNYYEVD